MAHYGIEIAKQFAELIVLKTSFLQIMKVYLHEGKRDKHRKKNLELVQKAIRQKEKYIKILRSQNRD